MEDLEKRIATIIKALDAARYTDFVPIDDFKMK